jgi:hypothetical protein
MYIILAVTSNMTYGRSARDFFGGGPPSGLSFYNGQRQYRESNSYKTYLFLDCNLSLESLAVIVRMRSPHPHILRRSLRRRFLHTLLVSAARTEAQP